MCRLLWRAQLNDCQRYVKVPTFRCEWGQTSALARELILLIVQGCQRGETRSADSQFPVPTMEPLLLRVTFSFGSYHPASFPIRSLACSR